MSEPNCNFSGSPDLYGFGIRLGIYFQWFAAWIANTWDLDSAFGMLSTNSIFLTAVFAAALRATTQHTLNAAEIMPLINIVQSYFMTVFPSVGWRLTLQTKKPLIPVTSIMSMLLRAVLWVLSSAYLLWYWFRGISSRHVSGCPVFIFCFFKANALGGIRTFFQIVTVFFSVVTVLPLLNILFSLVSTLGITLEVILKSIVHEKRDKSNPYRQPSFKFTVKSWIYFNFYPINENELMSHLIDKETSPGVRLVLNHPLLRTAVPILCAVNICLSIVTIELGITWNSLTGVGPHDILSTGQLIPFLVGFLSSLQVMSDLILKRHNVLHQEEMMTAKSEAEKSGYVPYQPEGDKQLDESIRYYRGKIGGDEELNPNSKERAKLHYQLADSLGTRYERHGYAADFDEARTHAAQAISLNNKSIRPYQVMGFLLRIRWQKTNEPRDLNNAIAHFEDMKKSLVLRRTKLVSVIDNLTRLKNERRKETNEGPDSLIEQMEELYSLMFHEYSNKPSDYLILSELYFERYEKEGGEDAALRKAILYAREVVKLTSDSFLDTAIRLNAWTQKLLDSYRSTMKGILLKRAIVYEKRAESSLTDGRSERANVFHWLGKLLAEQYKKERAGHIKEAIKWGELAVDTLDRGDDCYEEYNADLERWKATREYT